MTPTNFPFTVTHRTTKETVKIYKRTLPSGADNFMVPARADGKRRLKSFSTFELAKAEAERDLNDRKRNRTEFTLLTGPEREDAAMSLNRLKRLPTPIDKKTISLKPADVVETISRCTRLGLSLEEIEAAARAWASGRKERVEVTVNEAVRQYLDSLRSRNRSSKHLKDRTNRLGQFAKSIVSPSAVKGSALFGRTFGDLIIADVTTAQIQGWLDSLETSECDRKNHRSALTGLWGWTESRGMADPEVARKTEKLDPDEVAITTYSPDELRLFLNAANPPMRNLFAIGAFCGLRTSELIRLDWRDVTMPNPALNLAGKVTVRKANAKTGFARSVPMPPALVAWLELIPEADRVGSVGGFEAKTTFDQREGKVNRAQRKTAEKAGIKYQRNGLRHSFGTYLYEVEGQDEVRVSVRMGNTPNVVRAHYRDLTDALTANRWFAITPRTEITEVSAPAEDQPEVKLMVNG